MDAFLEYIDALMPNAPKKNFFSIVSFIIIGGVVMGSVYAFQTAGSTYQLLNSNAAGYASEAVAPTTDNTSMYGKVPLLTPPTGLNGSNSSSNQAPGASCFQLPPCATATPPALRCMIEIPVGGNVCQSATPTPSSSPSPTPTICGEGKGILCRSNPTNGITAPAGQPTIESSGAQVTASPTTTPTVSCYQVPPCYYTKQCLGLPVPVNKPVCPSPGANGSAPITTAPAVTTVPSSVTSSAHTNIFVQTFTNIINGIKNFFHL